VSTLAFLALACLVFIVPWEGNFTIEGLETFSRIFGAAAFVFGIAAVAMTFSLKRLHRALVPLVLFVAWSSASALWSINRDATLDRSISYLLLLLFAWLIWQYGDSVSRQQWLMRTFIIGTGVALANMLLNYVLHGDIHRGEDSARFTASGANPNSLAYSAVLSIVFAYYLLANSTQKPLGWLKPVYWGFIFVAGSAVFLTGSRSGALGLVIAVGLMLLTSRQTGWKQAMIFILCLAVISYMVIRFVPESLLARVQEVHTAKTFQDRMELWQTGLTQWTERPLQGSGSATNGGPGIEVAHNTFISILVDNGLIGLGLYLLFWILLLIAMLGLPKAERTLWLIVFASFSPAILSASAEHDKTLWFLCALVLAQAASLRSRALRPAPPKAVRFRPAGRPFFHEGG